MGLSTPPAAPAPARRTVPLAWVVVGVLVAVGILSAGVAAYDITRPPSTPGSVTLTDDLGRQVTVPYDPAHVAVLGPSIMDSMYRLGLRSHVVGVDCYAPSFGGLSSDYSSDQVQLWNLSSSMCIQTEPTFDIEELLALGPQLVLATTIVSVGAVEQISLTYHIPVVMLQPATLTGVLLDEQLLEKIFGASSSAPALEAQIQSAITQAAALQTNLTNAGTPFPTVLLTYSTDSNGYWTFGPGTFGQSLIELASGASISANSTLPYPELAGEQVLGTDPEYVVYGTGFGLNESYYAQAPFWSQLTATQDGRAVGMDSNDFTEPDPTMILVGLPLLISILHPGTSA